MQKIQVNINFKNEIIVQENNIPSTQKKEVEKRLQFYELYEKTSTGKKLIEKAYITKYSDKILYHTKDDIKEYPKSKLNEFLLYLYNHIQKTYLNIGKKLGDKEDIIKKSKSSLLYFNIKIMGIQIPVIFYLINIFGFKKTLNILKVNYIVEDSTIINKKLLINPNTISVKFKDKTIYFDVFSLKNKYILNGLLFKKNQIKEIEFKEDDNTLLDDLLNVLYGAKKTQDLKDSRYKIIDPTSMEILAEEGFPTDIETIYSNVMPSLILDRKAKANLDITNFRSRMGETILHLLYNQIQQAMSSFEKRKDMSNNKIEIDRNFIISNLMSAGLLNYSKGMNPLEELLLSNKISKTGIGNTTKQQVTLEKRMLNQSYFGIISPTATNEYSGIGSNQTLALGVKYKDDIAGIFEPKKFDNTSNSFENLSIAEALNPLVEYNDTTRGIMGNQQTGQFVELPKPDEPLVQTGMEAIVPHLVSSRFIKKAKKDGKIINIIPNKFIEIQYNNGEKEQISIQMIKARTKRGIFVPSEFIIQCSIGQKVKYNQILASTSSLSSGKLAIGKNIVVAECSYNGLNYEDGWVVTNDIIKKYDTKILTKLILRIPPNAKFKNFNIEKIFGNGDNTETTDTKVGDLLLELITDNYDIHNEFDEDNEEDVFTGLVQKDKSIKYYSPGGKIKDVVIKINNKDKVPQELLKWHKKLCEPIENKLKSCKIFDDPNKQIECLGHIENLETLDIGGHKLNNVEFDGAIIECYILTDNPVRHGSKFILGNSGGKGTIQHIIPKGKEPIALDSGLQVEFIGTPLSIIGRKSPNIIMNLYLGKIGYFMNKKIKEFADNGKFANIKKILFEVFDHLDKTKDKMILKQLEEFFTKDSKTIINFIKQSDPFNRPAFPIIMPPFKNKINMLDIENAAKVIDIKLNERLLLKEFGITTEREVVVGILNVPMLEHFPKAMSSARGSIKTRKQFVSGQGMSGTKEGLGAIKVGLYDMFSLLSKNGGEGQSINHLIKELHSIKSDSVTEKRNYQNSLLYKQQLPNMDIKQEINPEDTKTKNWIEFLFIGAGLQPKF